MAQVIKNWNVSGIFQAQSGTPFDVRTSVDFAGVGPGSGNQFYELVGDPNAGRTDWDDATNREDFQRQWSEFDQGIENQLLRQKNVAINAAFAVPHGPSHHQRNDPGADAGAAFSFVGVSDFGGAPSSLYPTLIFFDLIQSLAIGESRAR